MGGEKAEKSVEDHLRSLGTKRKRLGGRLKEGAVFFVLLLFLKLRET